MPAFSCQLESAGTLTAAAAGPRLPIQLCLRWDELNRFRDAWESLLLQNSANSIFMTPEWLGSWWQTFGKSGNRELMALVFLDQNRQATAIAPLFRESQFHFPFHLRTLQLVGAGSGDSDALDFIVRPGAERQVAETFLDWLSGERVWDTCSLETLPRHSVVGRHLLEILGRRRWRTLSEASPNFYIDLPDTWQAYLGGLNPQFRPLLARYPRRLQSRHRVNIFRCEHLPDLSRNLETLFRLHQMRWTRDGERGAFSNATRRDFYFRMAEAFLRRGWLEFWLLELDSETVAAQFCFRRGQTVYLLQEGFNPNYAAEKVGYALRAHVLQQMIEAGAKRYDFLGGDDPYKLKFGARQGSYLHLHFTRSSLAGRIHLARRCQGRLAKRWLRDHLPAPVLAVLKHPNKRQTART
jgi:CelD/BcsL family acetyltransferase involved in cellulose biosynthesis